MATPKKPVPAHDVKARLAVKIASLDDPVALVIESYIDSLALPFSHSAVPGSDLATTPFVEHFLTRLRFHHAANDDVLNKKSFEFAFKHACLAAGRTAGISVSATHPGQDITVDGVPMSLKTEAEKRISPRSLKISKFMEARWIRDCKSQNDFHARIPSILAHMAHYERLLVLRIFRRLESKPPSVRYDLVEIPLGLLKRIGTLAPSDFIPPRSASGGGGSAVVKDGAAKLFTLRLDGSVEKVTISGLDLSRCAQHASWTVSVPAGLVAAKEEGD
ncbi:MAG: hypothetical protein K2W96_22120 [Gemmataceae bacterium]|nr:hypothetical protein [Gemmataceae bacterium]